jgi:hypothetical protein
MGVAARVFHDVEVFAGVRRSNHFEPGYNGWTWLVGARFFF